MRNIFILSNFVLFLIGCTSFSEIKIPPSSLLFPDGVYNQEVELKVKEKDYDFECIIQKSSNSFVFVGYNSFGISLFKIKEIDGHVQMESSLTQIQAKKEFFLKVFELVKTLLSLDRQDSRLKTEYFEIEFQNIKSNVMFGESDTLGIPRKITIQTPGQYWIQIKTTQYKPN